MRLVTAFFLVITLIILSGCENANTHLRTAGPEAGVAAPTAAPVGADSFKAREERGQQQGQAQGIAASVANRPRAGGGGGGNAQSQEVALTHAVAIQDAARAADRKIIRNAELSVESDNPAEGQRKIAAIAEAHGGFVVTSEIKQHNGGSKPASTVTVVVRVPSGQFGAVIEKIRGIGGRFEQEKISGQDVTEEYIDLEARIRTKKALEAQFLEIMKQTRKIEDALQVQSQLADVRTEIERLEGRRRFLENQSSLSTITVSLQTPAPVVTANTFGFLHSFKEAFGDSIDMGTAIILGIIRLIAMLIPILLLIVLPGALVLRFLHRRFHFRLPKKQQQTVSVVPQPERSEVTAS